MNLLFIGDIVGRPGRQVVRERLPGVVRELEIDLVVANGENAAGGSGLTGAIAAELMGYGIDGLTLGDHVWDQKGFANEIDGLEHVCRPLNLPGMAPGRRFLILEAGNGFRLGVATLLGKEFMRPMILPPAQAIQDLLTDARGKADGWLIEVHAEATSEKVAIGWMLDGRVGAVIGTHTHIPTADGRVLPKGTAYLTDAGMTGPYASVLGREVGPIIAKLKDGLPRPFPVATDDVRLCGARVTLDPATGLATAFERVEVSL